MNENDSKLIVFDKDINEKIGDITYVKFINSNSAVFYNPLIAPKYFDNYIKENNIEKAYVINDDNMLEKASIYGALDLYLDFINIFIRLLELFGKRKD